MKGVPSSGTSLPRFVATSSVACLSVTSIVSAPLFVPMGCANRTFAPVLPPFVQRAAAQDVYEAAAARGETELAALFAGQSAGLIHDLPGAGDVVRALVSEAEAALRRAMPGV